MDTHIAFDIGPGLVAVLLAIVAAIPSGLAAYYGYMNGKKIDNGNGELASRLARLAEAKAATAALVNEPAPQPKP